MDALTRLELRTIKDICRHLGAGDGCTACHNDLRKYLEQFSCAGATA